MSFVKVLMRTERQIDSKMIIQKSGILDGV